MQRPTLADFMALGEDGPGLVGICADNLAGCAAIINRSTQRILYAPEGGDAGWWGSWVELAFDVSRADPFITAPFECARVIALDVCTWPVPLNNVFFEYLRYGAGRFPKGVDTCRTGRCAPMQAFDRGVFPLFRDPVGANKKLRFYPTDTGDLGKRVLAQYRDANGVPVRSLDGILQVDGEFLQLVEPFVDTTSTLFAGPRAVTGVLKDVTLGRVGVYEVDTGTGAQRQLGFMEPGETVAAYRRYYINGLPQSCCNSPVAGATASVTALCKLDYAPVAVPTDYLLVPNVEALTHEAQAVRYSAMDSESAKKMELYHHKAAIKLLCGQLTANEGKLNPAILFSPFGTATLARQSIGLLQ